MIKKEGKLLNFTAEIMTREGLQFFKFQSIHKANSEANKTDCKKAFSKVYKGGHFFIFNTYYNKEKPKKIYQKQLKAMMKDI